MKKSALLSILFLFLGTLAFAQYPKVGVRDIQFVDATKLANCNDSSAYLGDTITLIGVVIHDGNLTELASGSVQGGYRPGVWLADTSNGGQMGDFRGVGVMGVYRQNGQTLPVSAIDNLIAGMIVEITGRVSRYSGETQIEPLSNSSVTVVGTTSAPKAVLVDLSDLNDNNRTNQVATGEAYEGSFIELHDLTVTSVNYFSGNSRVSMDLTDGNGNVINVSDRFLVQKLSSYQPVNPNSPQSSGNFTPPSVGARLNSIKGIIIHSGNGCLGGTGRGYELNPFDTSHYQFGQTPPNITDITRNPLVPGASDEVTISASIIDPDGTVTSAEMYYSTDENTAPANFTKVMMTVKSGTTSEFEGKIPSAALGTLVRYYIKATDDASNESLSPFEALSSEPNLYFYTVKETGLTISDLQKVLNNRRDASPYVGEEVTVTGVVSASAKEYDLGYVFIQDPDETEWAGIYCTGNSDLLRLYRTEEVRITGIVQESFGFTTLNVTKVEKTGRLREVPVTRLTEKDTVKYSNNDLEPYESMVVSLHNSSGGKLYVNEARMSNFGEWSVAHAVGMPRSSSARIQTGIQNNNNNSSLYVSVVSDTNLRTTNGEMMVPVVQTEEGQTLDTITGMLTYGFSVYTIKPRNNDDIAGFSEELEKAEYPEIPTNSIRSKNLPGFSMYPNPSSDFFRLNTGVQVKGQLQIVDLQGRICLQYDLDGSAFEVPVNGLKDGLYFVNLYGENGQLLASGRIVKN